MDQIADAHGVHAAIRPYRDDDFDVLTKEIRASDVFEAEQMFGRYDDDLLRGSINGSDWCEVATLNGRPFIVFGVACTTRLSGVGVPWMVATDAFDSLMVARTPDAFAIKRRFLRESRRVVQRMADDYPRLENAVHADSGLTIRWLSWIGFSLDPPRPVGPRGEPFVYFHLGARAADLATG